MDTLTIFTGIILILLLAGVLLLLAAYAMPYIGLIVAISLVIARIAEIVGRAIDGVALAAGDVWYQFATHLLREIVI